ncbi:MAG: glycosyltransferase family 39 protein [Thermodesulfovibrio sp.]|uniref:glycosyltransferase family 39 protein n=2 Tax=unclassified Thermodesulfovibrio TaxID=2645936 RepID=UPI0024828556|nr:glycosyltransferase family 39 protein [Thermodesulfovibrio sp. 1176]MDI6714747.1 glycosyltransferase family 39 protein [Thermodesulfovibrio sp.]
MVFFTQRGYLLWLPVFLWIIFKNLKTKNYRGIVCLTFAIILGVFLSDWFSLEIKNIAQRIRPCHTEYFREVVGCTNSYSFPSNHATNSMAVATILILFWKGMALSRLIPIYIFSVALLICFSRIYLGLHWPNDVVGGAFLGIIIGFTVFKTTFSIKNIKGFFYFFLVVISLFRIYFILHGPVDLSPDEAHYWEWSRRLDLSYYSKGPMIAYLIALSTWIFGDNPFGVRILAVVCSFLSSIFIYKIAKKLFDEKTGYLSGIFFQLIPLFSTFGVLFTIDSPFILFWLVSMYLFLLALEKRKIYWVILGFTIGFGLLTKYTMAFFYVCMLLYLLKEKDYFKNSYLYLCLFISLVVFSPVIIWNFQHNWVTLKHTAGQAHLYEGFKISLKYFAEFIGSQLIVVTPLVFVLGLYLIIKEKILRHFVPQNDIKRDKNGRIINIRWFLISFSMPVFVFFFLKSLQGKVQANWAMPTYIAFVIAIAYAYERKILKKITYIAIIVATIFTFINYSLPYLNLPSKIDPSARLKGWNELGLKVSEIKKSLEKEGKVIIFSDRYQISSELAFYVQGKSRVYCIPIGRRMNQYDLWESINDELKNEEILRHFVPQNDIKREQNDKKRVNQNDKTLLGSTEERVKMTDKPVHGIYVVYGIKENPQIEVLNAFEKCIPESFTVYIKEVKIRDYTIFKCYNFKGMKLPRPESY